MKILIILLALIDAAILPIKGILTSAVFIAVIGISIWRVKNYKDLFAMSLAFISAASALYLIGGIAEETIVHKFSDWAIFFLLLGIIQLARYVKSNNGSKNS